MKLSKDPYSETAILKGQRRKSRQKSAQDVRISRQRHGGTTFVVSLPSPANEETAVLAHHPPTSKLRFVNNGVGDPVIWTPTQDPQHVTSTQANKAAREEGDCKRPNVLCFKTEDSTWCFQPGSADLACEQLGIWNRLCRQMRILPLWSAYSVPKHLSEATPGQLKTGLDLGPELFYPLDKTKLLSFNPMREMERYLWIPKSSAILTTSLMMGCLLEDVRLGRTNSPAFYALKTGACQALNAMIAAKERTMVLGDQAAMLICEMALSANLCGNHDDWRTHMLGLQALMDHWCSWRDLHEIISCNAIYLADVEGALAAGQSPILSFQRRFPLIEPNLPDERLISIRQGLETLTIAAQLPPATAETLRSACMFTHTVLHAKMAKETYHPHHMTEAFWGVVYDLLSNPSPLLSDSRVQTLGTAWNLGVLPILGKRRDLSTSLDAIVRIAALLFIREPMAEVVFSRKGYPQLLSLLATHLDILLAWVKMSQVPDEGLGAADLLGDGEGFKNTLNQHDWHTMTPSSFQAVRSLLVWSCVLGHLYAVRMDAYGMCGCVFKDVITEVCGGQVSKLKEADLVLFHLLDMEYVSPGKWDLARTLQHMMGR